MNTKALLTVLKRNFVSYFASPTAYLFICVFVAMSTVAAFWPNDFFNANLANLDQLNKYLPFVMLVFIPAVTMGIWADERRQGTDELVLTMPIGDVEVVLGKYLAAVAIFTVALCFSFVCNTLVLEALSLGQADLGLIVATYIGYWLVGLGMLAVGMAASFLTANLTVAYIFGVLFNLPLVFLNSADVLLSSVAAVAVKSWSISGQMEPFTRGLISLAGLLYFVAIAAVMLYLGIVLIGRRHWPTGESRFSGAVFYSLLHFCWVLTFLALGMVLRPFVDDFAMLCLILGLGYLAVQAVLMWLWTVAPNRADVTPIALVIPLVHVLLATAGLIAMGVSGLASGTEETAQIAALIVGVVFALAMIGVWWRFPRQASLMPGHYIVRVIALTAIAVGVVVIVRLYDVRADITAARLSSLAPQTRALLEDLPDDKLIEIEAFISPVVPEEYIQTRLNLINTLQEFDARSPVIRVIINDTREHSEAALRAQQGFDIRPQRVFAVQQGRYIDQDIFLGLVVKSGLEKVVVPFIGRGIPIEYELIRSIATVTQQERKRVGILETDAHVFGQFSFQGGGGRRWPIVTELEKQYEVVRVQPGDLVTNDQQRREAGLEELGLDADSPDEDILARGIQLLQLETTVDELTEEQREQCREKVEEEAWRLGMFDVLLAVQPSSLSPDDMKRFIACLSYGQPTVICEDPFSLFNPSLPGTSAPRQPSPQQMMMGGRPQPKGDISALWEKLGIEFSGVGTQSGSEIVYQYYNPEKKLALFDQNPEFVFVDDTIEDAFADHPIASESGRLLFPFPGWISAKNDTTMEVVPLVRTGRRTGYVNHSDMISFSLLGGQTLNPDRKRQYTEQQYTLAAYIEGRLPEQRLETADQPAGPQESSVQVTELEDKKHDVRLVLIADCDMLQETFFRLREQGPQREAGISFDFDNVNFILNSIDYVAGDERFIAIRKHRPKHATLRAIEKATEEARRQTAQQLDKLRERYEDIEREEDAKIEKQIEELRAQLQEQQISTDEILRRVAIAQRDAERRKTVRVEQIRQEIDAEIDRIETQLALEVQSIQNFYKMISVLVPPLFPLALAVIVFFIRRVQELEGVSEKRRLRGKQ